MAAGDCDVAAIGQGLGLLLPACHLFHAAGGVFVQRDRELLDQVVSSVLDEPRDIFGQMLRAFGTEIAQMIHHLVTHLVGATRHQQRRFGQAVAGIALPQSRVEVAALMFEFQEEGDMVDACHLVAELVLGQVQIMGQFLNRVLHRMAEAHLFQGRETLGQRPGVDRHRVDILQQGGVGADLHHVLRHIPKHRHRAQAAHDAANAQRVGDGLAQAVLFGDFEIGHRTGFIAADLKGGDNEIRALQRHAAVGVGRDGCSGPDRADHGAGHRLAFGQTHRVDIHQREMTVGQRGRQQGVAHDILHEDRGARSDKGNFRHGANLWFDVILRHRGSGPR